jgi:hypothetical protein
MKSNSARSGREQNWKVDYEQWRVKESEQWHKEEQPSGMSNNARSIA